MARRHRRREVYVFAEGDVTEPEYVDDCAAPMSGSCSEVCRRLKKHRQEIVKRFRLDELSGRYEMARKRARRISAGWFGGDDGGADGSYRTRLTPAYGDFGTRGMRHTRAYGGSNLILTRGLAPGAGSGAAR
jgi:hypothetical protein